MEDDNDDNNVRAMTIVLRTTSRQSNERDNRETNRQFKINMPKSFDLEAFQNMH